MHNENELIEHIESYYEKSLYIHSEFGGPSVYFHIQAIQEQRINFLSERHCEMIYATLASWGMHRMGNDSKTKMVDYGEYKQSLLAHRERLFTLNTFRIETSTTDDYINYCNALEDVYKTLKVSISDSTVVAHSKLLAHVLPDLLPPIDRQYTVRFYTQDNKDFFYQSGKYKNVVLPDGIENQFLAIVDYCVRIKELFDRCNRNVFQIHPNTINTSYPKIMDNVIMAFVKSVPKPDTV